MEKTFKKVYFRINAGYVWGKGVDKNIMDRFNEELKDIFIPLGFSVKKSGSGSAMEFVNGYERLYCHPMDLSGELLVESIEVVEKALQNRKTFKLTNIDIHGTFYLYSNKELVDILEEKREKVEKDLLSFFKTKRKNQFKPFYAYHDFIDNFLKVVSCIDKGQRDYVSGFIQGVFLSLIKNNKIIENNNERGIKIYRTA